MLIVFGGLPAAGKTTLAQAVARERQATYLRIDVIEQALSGPESVAGGVGPAGYLVAYALAESNLRIGGTVVADSVNPLAITREAWRRTAAAAGSTVVEVEVACSDQSEHRRRVETRIVDVAGLVPPTWQQVVAHEYQPWAGERIVIDTADRTRHRALAVPRELPGHAKLPPYTGRRWPPS